MTSVMVTIVNRTTGKQRTFTVEDEAPEYIRHRFGEWFPDVLDWVMTDEDADDDPDLRIHDVPRLEVTDLPIAIWEELTDNAA
jgi:hypothetical protein